MKSEARVPAKRHCFFLPARTCVLALAALAAATCVHQRPETAAPPGVRETERAVHLLSRATYGVRPQDVEDVLRMGRDAWLERQLDAETISEGALLARRQNAPQMPQTTVAAARGMIVVGERPAVAAAAAPRVEVRAVQPPGAPTPPAPEAAAALQQAMERAMARAREQLDLARRQIAVTEQHLRAATPQQLAAAQEQLAAAQQQLMAAASQLEAAALQQLTAAERLQVAAAQQRQLMGAQPARAVQVRAIVSSAAAIGALTTSKLERAVYSERQLEEVMTDFWFNHFNVFYGKSTQMRSVIVDYEESAIRPHVFGRFEDMLMATAQHAAMMIYLDNHLSTAPAPAPATPPRTTAAAARAQQQRGGLNENYARELMELHTLGVDGGYTQQDVIEVARAFTGWGITGTGANTTFRFNPERHDYDEKMVLGERLPAGRAMEEGLEVLAMLARHPSTAEHVATKLVRHFVADEAPPALVRELARVFRDSDGDLREVTRALFTAEAFYDPAHYGAKVKRPFEFVASALRVSGAEMGTQAQVTALSNQLRSLGHQPYSEPAPTGYPTTADEWLSAGAMLARLNLALDLGGGRINGVTLDPWAVLGGDVGAAAEALLTPPRTAAARTAGQTAAQGPGAAAPAGIDRETILNDIAALLVQNTLAGRRAPELQALIAADLAQQGERTQPRVLMGRAVALALGSPEFQRH